MADFLTVIHVVCFDLAVQAFMWSAMLLSVQFIYVVASADILLVPFSIMERDKIGHHDLVGTLILGCKYISLPCYAVLGLISILLYGCLGFMFYAPHHLVDVYFRVLFPVYFRFVLFGFVFVWLHPFVNLGLCRHTNRLPQKLYPSCRSYMDL